jgi:hypothetical protein
MIRTMARATIALETSGRAEQPLDSRHHPSQPSGRSTTGRSGARACGLVEPTPLAYGALPRRRPLPVEDQGAVIPGRPRGRRQDP